MKIILLNILYIVIAIFTHLFKIIMYIIHFLVNSFSLLHRFIRMQIHKQKKETKRTKTKPALNFDSKPVTQNTDRRIIGTTQTKYLVKLPDADANGCFHHQELEKENIPIEEEPDINPDDIDVSENKYPVRDILSEDDTDLSPDNDSYPSELSSGVTLEELNETYNTLCGTGTNKEQETKARDILSRVDGTVMMDFFMLQKECEHKAKRLMQTNDMEISIINISQNKQNISGFPLADYI